MKSPLSGAKIHSKTGTESIPPITPAWTILAELMIQPDFLADDSIK